MIDEDAKKVPQSFSCEQIIMDEFKWICANEYSKTVAAYFRGHMIDIIKEHGKVVSITTNKDGMKILKLINKKEEEKKE